MNTYKLIFKTYMSVIIIKPGTNTGTVIIRVLVSIRVSDYNMFQQKCVV